MVDAISEGAHISRTEPSPAEAKLPDGATPLPSDVKMTLQQKDGFSAPAAKEAKPQKLDAPALPEATKMAFSAGELKERTEHVLATVSTLFEGFRSADWGGEIGKIAEGYTVRPETSLTLSAPFDPGEPSEFAQMLSDILAAPVLQDAPPTAAVPMPKLVQKAVAVVQSFTAKLPPGREADAAPLLVEATAEFVILKCMELLNGDLNQDLTHLAKQLEAVKNERSALMLRLHAESGRITTLLATTAAKNAAAAAQARRMKRKKKKGLGAKIKKVVSHIVSAVTVVLKTLMAVLVVYYSFWTTLFEKIGINIKPFMDGVVLVFLMVTQVLGEDPELVDFYMKTIKSVAGTIVKDAGNTIQRSEQWYKEFQTSSAFAPVMATVMIIAALVMIVVTAGSSLPLAVKLIMAAAFLILQLAMAVDNVQLAFMARDMAKLQFEIDLLTIRLAEVQLEIKHILQQLVEKKAREDEVKDSISEAEDMRARMIENVNKAAESYSQFLSAQSLV